MKPSWVSLDIMPIAVDLRKWNRAEGSDELNELR